MTTMVGELREAAAASVPFRYLAYAWPALRFVASRSLRALAVDRRVVVAVTCAGAGTAAAAAVDEDAFVSAFDLLAAFVATARRTPSTRLKYCVL